MPPKYVNSYQVSSVTEKPLNPNQISNVSYINQPVLQFKNSPEKHKRMNSDSGSRKLISLRKIIWDKNRKMSKQIDKEKSCV